MTEQEIILIIEAYLADNLQKTKVSQLPDATTLDGLQILGVSNSQSVKASMTLLKGLDGKSVELRKTSTHIQWRVSGTSTWTDLMTVEELKVKGDKGDPFEFSDFTPEQLELLKGEKGDDIELQKTSTHIQWRVVGGTWANLVLLSDLKGAKGDSFTYEDFTPTQIEGLKVKGDPGESIELQTTATHIQWRLGTGAWTNLVALTELKGDTGANIELQKSATHVQWRVQGTTTWGNLILIEDLKVKGDTGANIELQKSTTHVQWRVQGTTTWTNLIPLSELKGEKGDAPVKGVDYFDGTDGKNAVMTIGTITTVASNAQADATVVADGVDVDGKPKFKLNLWLPKGVDGEGAGDMLKSVYDTQDRAVDVFEYVDNKVKTDVPENAKFTDTTYTEITEAEINTGTASTLRAITARRVTFILSKVTSMINSAISALTKSSVGLGNVDNIQQATKAEFNTHNSDSTRHITSAERTAWNAKGSSNLALGETSTTAYRGDRGLIAYNHSQATHAPVNAQKNSDITKAEIEAKLTGAITSHTHSAYVPTSRTVAGKALTGNITLAKGDVGLGNVDNTSDANKPVSTAQQTALNAKIDANKFQVVESLPASPTAGVFYFVKE